MKKNIVILGSTGSIGQKTLDVIKQNKKNFRVLLLSTNKNFDKIVNQAKTFDVKNIIINNFDSFIKAKKKYNKTNLNFFNSFTVLDEILKKKKVSYSMISIVGLDGLEPTLRMIKYTKNIAIVNKESLVCGWSLIKKKLVKFNTNFIPIDSEHFSIFELIKNSKSSHINRMFITASGGPFLNYTKNELSNVSVNEALKHPNWKMGEKISIDSATMMNKVFEVIEARNIFNFDHKKISILIHPKSYIHAVVMFKNGQIKLLAHDPDMIIPIYNSIHDKFTNNIYTKSLNLKILNNLNLKKINKNFFPTIKILDGLPTINSLYETALVTINDFFVLKFLEKKINFAQLIKYICKFSEYSDFIKFKKLPVKNINDINKIRKYVSLKLETLCI